MKTLLLFVALVALPLGAQAPPWEVGLTNVPAASTVVISQTVHVQQMTLVNTTGSAVTVTVQDLSTNCNGAACTVFAASIAANTTYTVTLGGTKANGGVQWVASTANAVSGWMRGTF